MYWVLEHEVIAVPRPVLRIVDDRLHSADGPAVHWPAGDSYYFWRGIQVPEKVILAPSDLTTTEILNERNSEVRRAMIERFGQERFILESRARVLDTAPQKGSSENNELLAIDLPGDPDGRLVCLKLRCPSTSAVYVIRVPPNMKSVQKALAWSYGFERKADYAPAVET